jgi:predicted methyltransferase
MAPVLSHYQASDILRAMGAGEQSITTSLDLGRSTINLSLLSDAVELPGEGHLDRAALQIICDNELACYLVRESELERIEVFSETFNRYYSLMPTLRAPTMLISGIPMHRIKDTDPHKDTLSKIKAVAPIHGTVLDTTMGLGYTAIEASRTAVQVTTIELDPAVLDICRCNPWSAALFDNPRITRLLGDAFDLIVEFRDQEFSCVLHDPPMFSLAGHLYSSEFYDQIYRVLRRKGRLFHYIGDPDSRSGRNTTRGVIRRLKETGFRRVKPYPRAFGVVAYK